MRFARCCKKKLIKELDDRLIAGKCVFLNINSENIIKDEKQTGNENFIEVNSTIKKDCLQKDNTEVYKNDNIKNCQIGLSAKTIWGKLVSKLRELNLTTLFTACGEIRDVSFNKNALIVKTKEEYLYNILVKDKNRAQIDFYLKEIDDKIDLELILDKNIRVQSKENLQKLTNYFGKELNLL